MSKAYAHVPVYHRPISSHHSTRPPTHTQPPPQQQQPPPGAHFYTTSPGHFQSFHGHTAPIHAANAHQKQMRGGSAGNRDAQHAPSASISARHQQQQQASLGRTMPAGANFASPTAVDSPMHIQTNHFAPPPAHLSQTQTHASNGAPPPWQHFRGPVAAVHRGGGPTGAVRGVPAAVRPQSSFAPMRPAHANGQSYNIITGLGNANSTPVSPAATRGGWEDSRRGSGSAAPVVLESPSGHARVVSHYPHPTTDPSQNRHAHPVVASGRTVARVGSATTQQRSQSVDRNVRSARNGVHPPGGGFDSNRFSHAQTLSASQMVLESARSTAAAAAADFNASQAAAAANRNFGGTQSLAATQRFNSTQPLSFALTQSFGGGGGPSHPASTTSRPGTSASSTSDDGASFIEVGVAEDPNPRFRPTMEDAHVIKLGDWVEEEPTTHRGGGHGPHGAQRVGATTRRTSSLDLTHRRPSHGGSGGTISHPTSVAKGRDAKSGYFAIYDGHGGREAVDYIERHLHKQLAKQLKSGQAPQAALEAAFLRTDEDMQATKNYQDSGSTVASALIRPSVSRAGQRDLFVANAGDARAVIAVSSGNAGGNRASPLKAMRLSMDHTPNVPSEAERVRRAGGAVFRGRVDGQLAVSRAIGDHSLKRSGVSAHPTQQHIPLTKDHKYMIVACDGIFDVLSDRDVVDLVGRSFKDGASSTQAAAVLVKEALARGTTDNVSAMVIKLQEDQRAAK